MQTNAVLPGRAPAPGLEVLERSRCLDLLSGARAGRLALLSGGGPTIVPVLMAPSAGTVRFAVDPAAGPVPHDGAEVALEADRLEPAGTSWSVLASGRALAVAGDSRPYRWYELDLTSLSGRAVRPSLARPALEAPEVRPRAGCASSAEALRLLTTGTVGYLTAMIGRHPQVFPVNYALDNGTVVFRTGTGSKLHALSRSMVAFEVDRLSPDGDGWSVVVEGLAQELLPGDPARLAAEALDLRPWAPGDKPYLVQVVPFRLRGHWHRWGQPG